MSPKSAANQQHLRLLEAILFIAERPISVAEIKQKLLLKDDNELSQFLNKLKKNLAERQSYIEIAEVDQNQAVEMRVKSDVKKQLRMFRTKKTMDKELMQTLAYIALKQPVTYTELRKVRKSKTKEHVEELEREGFIELTPSGRTKAIRTTLYFSSVFNIDPDHVQEKFKDEVRKRMVEILEK
jgi:segregation and condensation protein B